MKKYLIGFIAGIAVSSGFVFATNIAASDIKYIDSNSNETTVDLALDDLYTKASTPIVDRMNFGTASDIYAGDRKNGIVKSLSLSKGDYLISLTMGHAWNTSTQSTTTTSNITANELVTTNGSCTILVGKESRPFSSAMSNSKYQAQTVRNSIYRCHMNSTGTVKYTTNSGDYNNCVQSVILESVKID